MVERAAEIILLVQPGQHALLTPHDMLPADVGHPVRSRLFKAVSNSWCSRVVSCILMAVSRSGR